MPIEFQTETFFPNKKNNFTAFLFAILFFLSSADIFFATRILGFNFRWGQFLLFLFALPALYQLKSEFKNHSSESQIMKKLLLYWVPFFAVYGIAAIFSPTPLFTGVKWGWSMFNIGLAAIVCLNRRENDSLEIGFQWGILLIAGFIWLESIAIYVFGDFTVVKDLGVGIPGAVSFFSVPIGYAQISWRYMGFDTYRPNAFYYEPSYAGCALTFAFFILFFMDARRTKFKSGWIPALVVSSVILCSSRSGILSTALFFAGILITPAFQRKVSTQWRSTLKILILSILLIGLFCAFPNGRKYMEFLAGPLGTEATTRFQNKDFSEGDRLANAVESFKLWMQHPLLGNGVIAPKNNRGLIPYSMVTWLEIGLESGILGVAAFLFAILSNMKLAWKKCRNTSLKTLILTAWIIHFTVHLVFSQTFPRLDYWLLFFLSIRLLMKPEEEIQKTAKTGG